MFPVCPLTQLLLLICLVQATDKLLQNAPKSKKDSDGFPLPDQSTIEKLNQATTEKLGEIVRRNGGKKKLWQGYDAGEIAAARELLDSSSAKVVR